MAIVQINIMKTKPLTFLLALTFLFLVGSSSVVFADASHDAVIKEIRFLFSKWQPILKNLQNGGVKKSKTLNLGEEGILFIESHFGYFINWEVDYQSGDHFLSGDHYYNKKGELYFVFFRFQSFHGLNPKYWALDGTIIPSAEADPTISLQIPVTVERRLYFDQTGKIIRELESVYHMNTKEKTHRGYIFSDEHKKNMSYSYHLNELEFYKLLEDSP